MHGCDWQHQALTLNPVRTGALPGLVTTALAATVNAASEQRGFTRVTTVGRTWANIAGVVGMWCSMESPESEWDIVGFERITPESDYWVPISRFRAEYLERTANGLNKRPKDLTNGENNE